MEADGGVGKFELAPLPFQLFEVFAWYDMLQRRDLYDKCMQYALKLGAAIGSYVREMNRFKSFEDRIWLSRFGEAEVKVARRTSLYERKNLDYMQEQQPGVVHTLDRACKLNSLENTSIDSLTHPSSLLESF